MKEDIIQSQSRLNFNTSSYKKHYNNNSTVNGERERSFDNFEKESWRQKNVAEIQKQQIQLKNLDKESDLFNTRLIEEEYLQTCKKKFPYGI